MELKDIKSIDFAKTTGLPKTVVLILGLCVALVLSVLVGAIIHLVGRLVYLIILFPVAMGGLGFIFNFALIRLSRTRSIVLSILCGLIIGVTIYGSYHYFDYLQVQSETVNEWMAQDGVSGESAVAEYEGYLDDLFYELTGQEGFFGYFLYTVQEGIEIGRATSSSGGLNIGVIGTYIYYAIELLIVLIASAAAAFMAAGNYCENCEKWYDEVIEGRMTNGKKEAALAALERNNLSALIDMVESIAYKPYLKIALESCSTCNESTTEVKLLECFTGEADVPTEKTIFKKHFDRYEVKTLRDHLKESAE